MNSPPIYFVIDLLLPAFADVPVLGHGHGIAGRPVVQIGCSMGMLAEFSTLKPDVVVFVCNRKPRDVMDDTLQPFGGRPAWRPAT